jgi:DNA-binding transcriptional LysR family regulator
MRLSPTGERYAEACRRILADLEEAELLVAGERAAPRGILTLSAPPIAGEEILQPIVNAFLDAYPAVSVRTLLLDRNVNLTDEGVDVALRVGVLPDSSLIAIKVGDEVRRVVAASPGYLAQSPAVAEPGDLSRQQIVAMANFGLDSWVFPPAPGATVPRTVAIRPRLVVNTVRAALAAACEGLGVTRLYSYHVADRVRDGELQVLLRDTEPAPLPVHLVAQPSRAAVPKVRAFLDFTVPRLRAEFARLAAEARQMR